MTSTSSRCASNPCDGSTSQGGTPVATGVSTAYCEVTSSPPSVSCAPGLLSRGRSTRSLTKSASRVPSSVRSFDATVGTSPMAYLRMMRVERMARLLASTDLSVGEVARSVGWRNQFHASQCFHAAYGVSPTEFRRRHTTPPRIV